MPPVTPHARRPGATLIEVLVAIFVMAIGLLALLALFPVGVLMMFQAIQDEKSAQACNQATAIAQVHNLRGTTDAIITGAFRNPNPTSGLFLDATADEPSHPVYVDSVGVLSFLNPWDTWIGGQSLGVRRVKAPFAQVKASTYRWCTLLDDIVFTENGTPALTGGRVERDTRYSWAYLLRRPRFGDESVVNAKVVVYNQRPLALNATLQASEPTCTAYFDMPRNVIVLAWPTAGPPPPAISVGAWLMDITPVARQYIPPAPPVPAQVLYGPSHAAFYRVVGVNELGVRATMPLNGLNTPTTVNANVIEVEVQTPLQDFPLPPLPPVLPATVANPSPPPATETNPDRFRGTVAVMQGVAEVFDVGSGWK